MKKILVALVALCFAAPTFAQFSSGGFSLDESNVYYGLRIGANFSSLSGDYAYNPQGTKTGMALAGVIGFRLSPDTPLFLESGVWYTQRGAKKEKNSANFTYLEVPLLIKYGVEVADGLAVLPFFGPYFSFNIAGKYKYPEVAGSVLTEQISKHYKIADMGFKLGCGAEWNMLYLELGYQFGAYNLAKKNDLDQAARTGNLFVNVGVNF
jgi:hypothetical protein